MNASSFIDVTNVEMLSRPDPKVSPHPNVVVEKLKPARGLVIGAGISVVFWVLVGVGVYLLFRG